MKACIYGADAIGGWLGERLQTLADTLPRGGIDVEGTDCIQKGIWFKLRGNLTINPISARTGATTDRILDDDLVRGFVSAVMLEAKAIGEKLGLPIDQQPEDRHAVTRKLGRSRPQCGRMWRRTSPWRSTRWWALCGSWGRSPARPRPTPTPCWA